MLNINSLKNDLEKIKSSNPLIHNITNYVAMTNTANALLAIGASPAMIHEKNEVAEFASSSKALVINIGTLSLDWIESILTAGKIALNKNIPLIFDPAGCGSTSIRNIVCAQIIKECKPKVIRGNASEIINLNEILYSNKTNKDIINKNNSINGLDSTISSTKALDAAKNLAKKLFCIIVTSGETDYITNGNEVISLKNGDLLMTKVTAMGCTSTALIASFTAVNNNFLEACTNAMAVIGVAGQLAAKKSKGPGSLQVNILDQLYSITHKTIKKYLKQ